MEKETTITASSDQDYVLAEGKPNAGDGIHGTEVEEGQVMGMPARTKQGHMCCGGCCDMRRATMIVNYINIGMCSAISTSQYYLSIYSIYQAIYQAMLFNDHAIGHF